MIAKSKINMMFAIMSLLNNAIKGFLIASVYSVLREKSETSPETKMVSCHFSLTPRVVF